MLRRFRTWLADVIRPVDVQPAPAPVIVAAEQPLKMDQIDEIDKHIQSTKILTKRRLKQSDYITTKTFAMILGISSHAITDWKNGKYKSPVGSLPSHIKTSAKHAVMWDRVECLVFAHIFKQSDKWTEGQISMVELGQILGITSQAAYHAAVKWHKANKNRSSWKIDDSTSRRVINRGDAIEIGLERAGLAV